ncbi:hepatitis A virus cellular receptor 2 homolog [Bufo gargarizans]|uniref:hepatitis A virus cellular receptor 2 homolog n=1 Tax=Bufo gargarizans TaxID=30331 RepID=UPI001CF25EC1|nr:hepatitis A virus cellular receptor 2 homolog [Bufo gargarizans]
MKNLTLYRDHKPDSQISTPCLLGTRWLCTVHGATIISSGTDGQKVTWRKSDRYQLLGNISQGDVSLTITGATNEDEGTYCCRVHIPGIFNDMKEEVNVKIQEAGKTTTETANSKQTEYFTSSVSDNLVTLTTQMIFLNTQETITPEQSKSPDATTDVIAGVFGALFLVTLMGASIYMCKTRSGKQTKTESTMSVINMEALAETGNDAMENIYT